MPLLVGLDVGTQGARAIVCDESGRVVALCSRSFSSDVSVDGLPSGRFEQHPRVWWEAAESALVDVVAALKETGRNVGEIAAIAVDSTSGTILPVDDTGEPLRPALMYNDGRAEAEAKECNAAGAEFTDKLGYKFGSSFGLPKILWLARHEPNIWHNASRIIHAADYIVGKLTGDFSITDNSNAMKTGYDLMDGRWPEFIGTELGIDVGRLPNVVSPGEVIGAVSAQCASSTGLAAGTNVVGGVSDGTAGFVASGASGIGEWNSTIGTTLVMRGVSRELVKDPLGRVYCHKHPDGYWLPGGASNVGGECLAKVFPNDDYDKLNACIGALLPTAMLVYPLMKRGERLPFVDGAAEGFVCGEAGTLEELYAAYLEGVAFVERWCFELMAELGAEVGDTVYATGGGAKSLEWMGIRACVLRRQLVRPAVTDSAMGAAVVAASRTVYSSLNEASKAMIRRDAEVGPVDRMVELYQKRYSAFRRECAKRGIGEG